MRLLRAGFLPVSLLILVAAALVVPIPYSLERPGRVLSLQACVEVQDERATPLEGDFLLMTISFVPSTTTVDALVGILDDEAAVVPRDRIIPPGQNADQYVHEQRAAFASTADVAVVVGLQEAGEPARLVGDGVEVLRVQSGAPAEGILVPGDVITQVDGTDISVESELRAAIEQAGPNPLQMTVTRGGEDIEVEVTPVELDTAPRIGVVPATVNARPESTVPVTVSYGSVGGPSAGLMIALTVYDKMLPGVDLAARRVVAGTGTIYEDGTVGPIGGIGLKVIGAHRAGADVFLAPAANHAEAVAALPDGSGMEVLSVEDFAQAREALEDSAQSASGSGRSTASLPEECPYATTASPAPTG